MSHHFVNALVVIGIVLCASYVLDNTGNPINDKLGEKVITYQRKCSNYGPVFECEKSNLVVNKIVFRADYEKQQVYYMSGMSIWKWNDCVVFDAQNWRCQDEGSMTDGHFIEFSHDAKVMAAQVSYLNYLLNF